MTLCCTSRTWICHTEYWPTDTSLHWFSVSVIEMGVALHLGAGLLWGYRILALSFALDHETDSKQLVQALIVKGCQRAGYSVWSEHAL